MDPEKNSWVEETLRSLEGAKATGPDPQFFERVQGRLQNSKKVQPVKIGWVGAAAACFALLITFNAVSLKKTSQDRMDKNPAGIEAFAQDYEEVYSGYNY